MVPFCPGGQNIPSGQIPFLGSRAMLEGGAHCGEKVGCFDLVKIFTNLVKIFTILMEIFTILVKIFTTEDTPLNSPPLGGASPPGFRENRERYLTMRAVLSLWVVLR